MRHVSKVEVPNSAISDYAWTNNFFFHFHRFEIIFTQQFAPNLEFLEDLCNFQYSNSLLYNTLPLTSSVILFL